MPGGILNVTWGTWVNQIMPNTEYKDKIGIWGSFKIGNNEKRILIINACRITNSRKTGDQTTKAQLDRIDRAKKENDHWKKMLDDIIKHVNDEKEVNYVLLFGDLNQDIYSPEIHHFMNQIGLCEIYDNFNQIDPK